MRREIVSFQRDLGTTTVYVTHDQTEAMTMGSRIAVLRDGVLQQAGTPREVYDRPANLFVARFIGSPPMNVWEGEYRGRPCTVGIRPEHVYLAGEGEPGAVRAIVTDVERTGRESLLFLNLPGMPVLTAAVGADCARCPGEETGVILDRGRLHFFDRETEQRL